MKIDLQSLLNEEYELSGGLVSLRKLKKDNLELDRLKKIDLDGEVRRFVVIDKPFYDLDEQEVDKYIDGEHECIVLGISGEKDFVGEEESGKLQGVLYVYFDSKERIEEIQIRRLVEEQVDCFVEIGYAKVPGAKTHQISNGVRAFLRMIRETYVETKLTICITAYAESENLKSIMVLEAAGFNYVGEVVYNADKSTNPDKLYVFMMGLAKEVK